MSHNARARLNLLVWMMFAIAAGLLALLMWGGRFLAESGLPQR